MPSYATINYCYEENDPSMNFSFNATSYQELSQLLINRTSLNISSLHDRYHSIGINLDSRAGNRLSEVINDSSPIKSYTFGFSTLRWLVRACIANPPSFLVMLIRHMPFLRSLPHWRIIRIKHKRIKTAVD